MDALTITKSLKASIVVGIDLGTTFSGFAYAHTSTPNQVHTFYEWPDFMSAGGSIDFKTLTSVLYEAGECTCPGSYNLKAWGYSALVQHARSIKTHESTVSRRKMHYITLFKLHLAGSEAGRVSAPELPPGLTARRVVSDYLRKMSQLIMEVLHDRIGRHVTMDDVQWCLTVPAMWNRRGRQEMKTCAEIAGMVKGPKCPPNSLESASRHPIMIVIETEAAALYFQRLIQFPLMSGDKFLIVDAGETTVDLALLEKVGRGSTLRARQLTSISDGYCGGSDVDDAFFKFLSQKIGCFPVFAKKHPDSIVKLKGWWKRIKLCFDRNLYFPQEIELPARLARAWEDDDSCKNQITNLGFSYDCIELSLEDMLSMFDPVVAQILKLIELRMIEDLKVLMIMGTFSASPYLVNSIRQKLSARVGTIVVPVRPGTVICSGAVVYGLCGPDLMRS